VDYRDWNLYCDGIFNASSTTVECAYFFPRDENPASSTTVYTSHFSLRWVHHIGYFYSCCDERTVPGRWSSASQEKLTPGLQEYRTQTPYTQYVFGPRENLPPPGAGDLLATVLDVSIVALAIPMFHHRAELKRHVCIPLK